MLPRKPSPIAFLTLVALSACGAPDMEPELTEPCGAEDQTQCMGADSFRVCTVDNDGQLRWSEPSLCGDGTFCTDEAASCVGPSESEAQMVDWVGDALDIMQENGAWVDDFPLERDALQSEVTRTIVLGGGSNRSFYQAMRLAALAYPVGHQAIYPVDFDQCSTMDLYWQTASRLGACARPSGDDFVITHTLDGNPLGLSPGDRVVAVDGASGEEMIDYVLRFPVCGNSHASDANRRISAATSVFGSIPTGARVSVMHIDGSESTVEVPPYSFGYLDCRDPMGRDIQFNASSWLRDDGIAVVRVPRLYPLGGTGNESFEELYAEMEGAVLDAFDAVAGEADGIIWDFRGNIGGITYVGLSIASGMKGVTETRIAHCGQRVAGSEPVTLAPGSEFNYDLEPNPESPFAYDGPAVVLVDGLAVSAADYFTRAVSMATDVPLVGTGSAGGYGGSGATFELESDPAMSVAVDVWRCDDGEGAPLETTTATPDVFVEMGAEDLAGGIDTQLEAAAELLH